MRLRDWLRRVIFRPSDQSAFEETAHQPLPESPTIQQFRLVTLGDFLEMTPTEFEQLCVRELSAIGFREVRRTGGAGDLAADIVATDIQGRSCIVQCKRYAPGSNVGSPTVQMFIGMKAVHHKADRGIIMTTAEFSRPAVDLAKQHDIVLIDGDDMVKIVNLLGKGSGRSAQPTSPMSSAAAMEPSVKYSSAGVGGGGANPPSPLRPTAQAITCPRCGATNLPTSIRFCSNCGLQRTEPPTGTPAVLETARGDHCPRCGRRNRTGEWFCRHCGFQLRR